VEVLDVIDDLRVSEGLTVVAAAHDLTLAGRYADRLVLLDGGEIVAEGAPIEVLTEKTLTTHYGAGIRVIDDRDGPIVVPQRNGNGRTEATN
jgi:iron complex transport system ATP-binding protein